MFTPAKLFRPFLNCFAKVNWAKVALIWPWYEILVSLRFCSMQTLIPMEYERVQAQLSKGVQSEVGEGGEKWKISTGQNTKLTLLMQREETLSGLSDWAKARLSVKQYLQEKPDNEAICCCVRPLKQSELLDKVRLAKIFALPSIKAAIISDYSLVAKIISLQLMLQVNGLLPIV